MRSWHVVSLALVGVLALTFGVGHSLGTASSDHARPAAKAPHGSAAQAKFVPSRMAAIGDSVTAGFLTCFNRTCPANSWSTGTSIDSHYKRILAVNPKIVYASASGFGSEERKAALTVRRAFEQHPQRLELALAADEQERRGRDERTGQRGLRHQSGRPPLRA